MKLFMNKKLNENRFSKRLHLTYTTLIFTLHNFCLIYDNILQCDFDLIVRLQQRKENKKNEIKIGLRVLLKIFSSNIFIINKRKVNREH